MKLEALKIIVLDTLVSCEFDDIIEPVKNATTLDTIIQALADAGIDEPANWILESIVEN